MKTMKGITVLMTVLFFISYQGFSQNTTTTQKDSKDIQPMTKVTPGKFVDNNKDGVCDNYQTRVNSGRGANFIDKNGDGVCDNRGNFGNGRGNPNRCGKGYQNRNGQGRGNCCGRGNGYQHRHGQGN
jgi:hypothetical protein